MAKAISDFQVSPIGSGENSGTLTVQISKEHIAALKYLSAFSHAILFFRNQHESTIFEQAVKTVSIDEKTGTCIFERLSASTPMVELIDIKPYFPCEDRVTNAVCSLSANEIPATTEVTASAQFCGKIEKRNGETFVVVGDKELLKRIDKCSHIKIFWWFSRFDKPVYRRATECNPPYENAPRTGIFASRSPVRPNPIALTTARIKSVDFENGIVATNALDCFDGTPIISIAPYIAENDRKDEVKVPHWLEHWPSAFSESDNSKGSLPEAKPSPVDTIMQFHSAKEAAEPCELFAKADKEKPAFKREITVTGARQNNLKGFDVSIPHNKITVVTGVSGCGKSSLVFDTIFAESQFRFFEGTGTMPSAKIKQAGAPKFDTITGLTPSIAVSPAAIRNPRSTFGTITGLYDLLRSLFAGIGTRHCPTCGEAIVPLSPDLMSDLIQNCDNGTLISIQPHNLPSENNKFVIERQNSQQKAQIKARISDSLAKGLGAIDLTINGTQTVLQTTQMCYRCSLPLFELTPATFSFNNPESCCPTCNGTGEIAEIDPKLIVANPELSILDGASSFWGDLRKFLKAPNANWMKGEVLGLAQKMGIDLETPWSQLSEEFRRKALFGSEGEKVVFRYKNANGRTGEITRPVEGAVNILKRLLDAGTGTERILEQYSHQQICPTCHGERLNKEGRLVTVAGKRISEITALPVSELKQWTESLPAILSTDQIALAKPILKEMHKLCEKFTLAGLSYISLNRKTATLSGGELQRTRLITQLLSGITNVSYILDEPFTGLHSRDIERLFGIIRELKANGNTVIMVEHNRYAMLNADHIIDIGPGAGSFGGEIVAQGSPQEIMQDPHSQTGLYLSNQKEISVAKKSRSTKSTGIVTLTGAKANNLKNIDVSFPTGAIVCICGVSGSGKSSLVEECLYPAVQSAISGNAPKSRCFDSISGADAFSKIIFVDQKPIGRNSRSTPASYTGAMDLIRNVFAATPEAKSKKYKASRFSFNSKDGQCHECNGEGVKHLKMPFAPDSEVECPCCKGTQFNSETLAIRLKGKNIAEVLQMSIDEALEFFADNAKISKILQTLSGIGLGYLKLGQNSASVSGGEAQRIKLATELCASSSGKSLYILDEPSRGLHFKDISNLIAILQKIADEGNSVVLVEHNQDIIRNADVVVELGPTGGKDGGYIVMEESHLNRWHNGNSNANN